MECLNGYHKNQSIVISGIQNGEKVRYAVDIIKFYLKDTGKIGSGNTTDCPARRVIEYLPDIQVKTKQVFHADTSRCQGCGGQLQCAIRIGSKS